MSNKPTWRIARLDEMDQRGSDLPIREYLGIHAFGFNIQTPEDGVVVNEHDEVGTGQEELYVVLDGNVTFEIDGEAVEAKPGTLLSVAPQSSRMRSPGYRRMSSCACRRITCWPWCYGAERPHERGYLAREASV